MLNQYALSTNCNKHNKQTINKHKTIVPFTTKDFLIHLLTFVSLTARIFPFVI